MFLKATSVERRDWAEDEVKLTHYMSLEVSANPTDNQSLRQDSPSKLSQTWGRVKHLYSHVGQ